MSDPLGLPPTLQREELEYHLKNSPRRGKGGERGTWGHFSPPLKPGFVGTAEERETTRDKQARIGTAVPIINPGQRLFPLLLLKKKNCRHRTSAGGFVGGVDERHIAPGSVAIFSRLLNE